jgi:hypothetical protein
VRSYTFLLRRHLFRGDSVIVWTGDIGQKLPSGEMYWYDDVLYMMRTVWRESCARIRLEPASAAYAQDAALRNAGSSYQLSQWQVCGSSDQ